MVTTLTTCGVNESGALLKESMSIRPEAIGKIIMFAGNTAPEGTLYCNGAAISRTTYSELFAAIGTTYGAGDGATTFNIPDLRDKWAVGSGTLYAQGASVAEGLPNVNGIAGPTNILTEQSYPPDGGTLIEDEYYDVTHGALSCRVGKRGYLGNGDATQLRCEIYWITLNAAFNSTIYGSSQHVQPASVALLPCIIYE